MNYEIRGLEIRESAKKLVIDFMRSNPECQASSAGLSQSEIFRKCGLDWGDRENATSSNQQYWVVALLRELEFSQKIERVRKRGPWRLCKNI